VLSRVENTSLSKIRMKIHESPDTVVGYIEYLGLCLLDQVVWDDIQFNYKRRYEYRHLIDIFEQLYIQLHLLSMIEEDGLSVKSESNPIEKTLGKIGEISKTEELKT